LIIEYYGIGGIIGGSTKVATRAWHISYGLRRRHVSYRLHSDHQAQLAFISMRLFSHIAAAEAMEGGGLLSQRSPGAEKFVSVSRFTIWGQTKPIAGSDTV